MDGRRWTHHLRLLPGGDVNLVSAIATTGTLYVIFLFVGWIVAMTMNSQFGQQSDFGALEIFSVSNALPCFVIMSWTGLRVRSTKPIALDEAAVHIENRRVYFGDEVARVPTETVAFSTRPRQVSARMSDGQQLTAFFRVNGDAEDLLNLAREMRQHPGLAVEDWVHTTLERLAKELLPDPQGIREALAEDLLRRGIVVTRVEVA
jgi:hypothetical protein